MEHSSFIVLLYILDVTPNSPGTVYYALVQYKFQEEEHALIRPPHKSSKGSTPYKRTNPSTLQRVKEVVKDHKPSSAFELVDAEMGGMEASSSSKLPRSKSQCADVRKRLFATERGDELAVMMEICKCVEKGEIPFVRSVLAAPQPLCVLATDIQLKQLQLCCTDPKTFSVLSIDPTFNLGSFYVTPMVFLHKAVISKRTHRHPVFIGPLLIHLRMNLEAYSFFAHQIQILLPSLSNIRAFGTDGELALVTAFKNAYPNAIHLRCFKHFQDNCDAKLRALNLVDAVRQEILGDIVGVEGPDQRELGLVDAVDEHDFDTKLAMLEERWEKLEKEGRKMIPGEVVQPQFYSWFVSEKRDVVRSSMLQSVRIAAQLGNPPDRFYTNASESTNNILKLKVDRKQQSLPAFVTHVQELVSAHEKNIERAFFRRGDWRLSDAFSPFEAVSQLRSRKKLVKKVLEASCCLTELATEASLHAPSTSAAAAGATASTQIAMHAPSTSSEASSSSRKADPLSGASACGLSVSCNVALGAGMGIHEDTLKGIWGKAESLVSDDSLVVAVPGSSKSYHRMVASSSSECPHLVTTPAKFTGQFKCDSKCTMYATYKICSHTVAAAEVSGKLIEFLEWHIKQKSSPNLTNLSLAGIPKGAGEKGGVPKNTRKRRRASVPATKKAVVDRLNASSTPTSSASLVSTGPLSSCAQTHMQAAPSFPPQQMYWYSSSPFSFSPHYPTHSSTLPTPASTLQATDSSLSSSAVVSPFPFTLKILTERIRICQGCRIPFHPHSDQPPYDLVICRKECRPYRGQGGHIKTPSMPSNSHYHVSMLCVRSAEPTFLPQQLSVPGDVHAYLTMEHKQFIFSMLGLQL